MGSIWTEPLETLYVGLAAAKPSPAGVTAAAVSARLGMGLLIKTLEITARRDEAVRGLIEAARGYSAILAEAADEDISGSPERKRIEIPMKAARAAAAGLDLCSEAAGLVRGALAADVGVAGMMLGSAVRAIVLCVDSNAGDFQAEERRELVGLAGARVESIIGQVSKA
ncbi:MAG TPA: cyclodeaminase/cyclohydrolase family protein [Bryobacteraceae bacterium]